MKNKAANNTDAKITELKKKAEGNDAESQYALGKRYYEGKVVSLDYKKAAEMFRAAAKQHYADALFMLGLMYAEGKGVTHNYKEAVKWYRFAADQGHAGARSNLGKMYSSGKGIPQNYSEAYIWFSLAAMDGNKDAIKNRDFMEEKLTSADLNLAQHKALERDEEARKKIGEEDENLPFSSIA